MNKQIYSMMDAEGRDLLLFEYLEGNLSVEDATSLEALLVTDPNMASDLANWQAAYIRQDIYDTSALEAQLLLNKAAPVKNWGRLIGITMILCSSLLSSLSLEEPGIPVSLDNKSISITQAPAEDTRLMMEETQPIDRELIRKSTAVKELITKVEVFEITVVPAGIDQGLELPVAEAVAPIATSLSNQKTNFRLAQIKKAGRNSQIQPKAISRKEQRKIRRTKEKAFQLRKAKEFLKGNRPYVVPLDYQSF